MDMPMPAQPAQKQPAPVKRPQKEPAKAHDMPGMDMPGMVITATPKQSVTPPKKGKPDTMPPMAGMKHPNN
jgi:hypothetical protein